MVSTNNFTFCWYICVLEDMLITFIPTFLGEPIIYAGNSHSHGRVYFSETYLVYDMKPAYSILWVFQSAIVVTKTWYVCKIMQGHL